MARDRRGDLCGGCEKLHEDAVRGSNKAAWARETLSAIEAVLGEGDGFEASLYDLFEVKPPHLVQDGATVHLGAIVGNLGPGALRKLAGWMEGARPEAAKRYGARAWWENSTYVALVAGLSRLVGGSVRRVDGTREDTRFYFLAKRLVCARGPGLPVTDADRARSLGVAPVWFHRMRQRASRLGYPLDGPRTGVPVDALVEILRSGRRRGPRA